MTYRLHRSAAWQCLIASQANAIRACLFMGVKLQISNSSSVEAQHKRPTATAMGGAHTEASPIADRQRVKL